MDRKPNLQGKGGSPYGASLIIPICWVNPFAQAERRRWERRTLHYNMFYPCCLYRPTFFINVYPVGMDRLLKKPQWCSRSSCKGEGQWMREGALDCPASVRSAEESVT